MEKVTKKSGDKLKLHVTRTILALPKNCEFKVGAPSCQFDYNCTELVIDISNMGAKLVRLFDATPYSKMAENILFFCLYVNWPSLPRIKQKVLLNSADAIEAVRAN